MTIEYDHLIVESPHGSGGRFLSSVLAACTKNLPWKSGKVNYHTVLHRVHDNHWFDPAPNILSLDDPLARYNFWIYYFRKRVVYELDYYRYHGKKWIRCPYETLDSKGDAFWLLNQCRFIIKYQTQQTWKLSWIQMLEQPADAWNVINNFLEENNQPNYWTVEQWIASVGEYQKTLSKKITMNPHHVRWQIWATALLQEQGIVPDFDLVDNFRNNQFLSWLDKHNHRLLEQTQELTWVQSA